MTYWHILKMFCNKVSLDPENLPTSPSNGIHSFLYFFFRISFICNCFTFFFSLNLLFIASKFITFELYSYLSGSLESSLYFNLSKYVSSPSLSYHSRFTFIYLWMYQILYWKSSLSSDFCSNVKKLIPHFSILSL